MFYRVLPGFAGFYPVLPKFNRVSATLMEFYRVLPGFAGFHQVTKI